MLKSILTSKCPRCRKGDLFIKRNPYALKHMTDMHECCTYCGQRCEPEPGFYYGAMYVSYAFGVGIFLANFFLFEFFLSVPDWLFLTLNTSILLVLWPVFFRLARMIYLNFFVHYDPKIVVDNKEREQVETT